MATEYYFDVTTLGEALIRFSVPPGERLESAERYEICSAGAEANVVAALSQLGRKCAWAGALPENPLGRLVVSQMSLTGINLEAVVWFQEGRIGTYFVELAVPPRPVMVIYDRANSCTTNLSSNQVNWDHLLAGRILHLTGITPALSVSCFDLITEAVCFARERSIPVCFDVNYRDGLWSTEEARLKITPLIQGVEILLCGRDDASRVFGCEGDPEKMARDLKEMSRAKWVVLSLQSEGVLAWDGKSIHHQSAFPVQIIDPIGAGDALAAGILHGWLDGSVEKGLRYGSVLAALALSQKGDMLRTSITEVEMLLEKGTGGIRR